MSGRTKAAVAGATVVAFLMGIGAAWVYASSNQGTYGVPD